MCLSGKISFKKCNIHKKRCLNVKKCRYFWLIRICFIFLHRSLRDECCCSSGVEHFLGKEEVVSSILINSSESHPFGWLFLFGERFNDSINSRPPKSSFVKGGFRRNINITPTGASASVSSILINSSENEVPPKVWTKNFWGHLNVAKVFFINQIIYFALIINVEILIAGAVYAIFLPEIFNGSNFWQSSLLDVR